MRLWHYGSALCVLVGLGLAPAFVLGQVNPAAPASKPAAAAMLPPTPEQRKVIDQANRQPADQPAPKLDLRTSINGEPNPNFGQIDAGFQGVHKKFLERRSKPVGLLFLGDSITAGWPRARQLFDERYGKYDVANFGIGGDRTQHVLWRIENGELDGISPKVVVLMIGTNNSGLPAEQMTAGVTKIVEAIHAKLPNTKVLLLGIFPRSEKATDAKGDPSPIRVKLQQVNANLAKLDDGKQTRYLEIWKQFLGEDGSLSKEIMPDFLHPSAKGYQIWADTMQPLLDEMMKAQ